MAEEFNNERNPETLFEPNDASVREVVFTGAGVGFGVLIVCLVIWGVFNLLKTEGIRTQTFSPRPEARELPPQPRLQVNAPAELYEFRRQEEQMLNSYGWVNKNAGTVRIPINQAMDILVKRGLPTRTPAQTAEAEAGKVSGSAGVATAPASPGAAVAGAQPQVQNPATPPRETQGSRNEKK
jgi:hypothetical protein